MRGVEYRKRLVMWLLSQLNNAKFNNFNMSSVAFLLIKSSYNKTLNMKRIFIISLYLTIAILICNCESSQTEDLVEDNQIQIYEIGDTGPAGGIVFHDKGNSSEGWQYIEVSLEEFEDLNWGCHTSGIPNSNNEAIGFGRINTEEIVKFHDAFDNYYDDPSHCNDQNDDGTVAAKFCDQYVSNGFEDWHLPSSGEVVEMYNTLHLNGISPFNEEVLHWSSTQHDEHTAISVDFSTSDQGFLCNQCGFHSVVRPVRYF